MSNNPEQLQNISDIGAETIQSTSVQLEKLNNSSEKTGELSPRDAELRTERARTKAIETAISIESGGNEAKKTNNSPASRRSPINKKQLNESYKRTIKRVQSELPAGSRTFSKVIHNKVVEKTSDIIGGTIARPNAVLAGAATAFVLTLVTYITAKNIGYILSGSETIIAFVVGWILGIFYDYLRVLITGKK